MIDLATLLRTGVTAGASGFGLDRRCCWRVLCARIPPCVAFRLGSLLGCAFLCHGENAVLGTGRNGCLQTLTGLTRLSTVWRGKEGCPDQSWGESCGSLLKSGVIQFPLRPAPHCFPRGRTAVGVYGAYSAYSLQLTVQPALVQS